MSMSEGKKLKLRRAAWEAEKSVMRRVLGAGQYRRLLIMCIERNRKFDKAEDAERVMIWACRYFERVVKYVTPITTYFQGRRPAPKRRR